MKILLCFACNDDTIKVIRSLIVFVRKMVFSLFTLAIEKIEHFGTGQCSEIHVGTTQ